jgi:hypothetical protein
LQHNLLHYQRLSIAIRHSTRHKRDMADELSYDDAVALLLREFGGIGGKAESRLQYAVNRDGVRVRLSGAWCSASTPRANGAALELPSTRARSFPWQKVKYNASDLNVWIDQERRRLERIEARDAEPTGHPPVNAHASPKAKPGRKPKWDWIAIGKFVAEQMNHYDDFSNDDPNWQGMADLERAVQEHFAGNEGGPPHGTLQPYLSAMVEAWRGGRKCR